MTEKCPWEAGKEYTLRNGMRARIYATDGGGCPIHGAILKDDGWRTSVWMADGRNSPYAASRPYDLLPPPKPRIKRDLWVNVFRGGAVRPWDTRSDADRWGADRSACVKVHIDVEEGHGLDGDPA